MVIYSPGGRGVGYSYTLPIRVCAAQRGRDFEAPEVLTKVLYREAPSGYQTLYPFIYHL